jgi:hypothetical protein
VKYWAGETLSAADASPLMRSVVVHGLAAFAVSEYPFPLESPRQLALSNLYQMYVLKAFLAHDFGTSS